MSISPYRATGYIRITEYAHGSMAFEWGGGETVAVPRRLLQVAVPPHVTFAHPPHVVGDRFGIGPYELETIGFANANIIARRIT